MTDLLIAQKNKAEIANFIHDPRHALILVAPEGSGKLTLARYIAAQLLKLSSTDQLNGFPYYYEIHPENKLISIDKIRELIKVFRLKTTGQGGVRRVVVIENSHLMNDESQNSLLKTLEEPPEDSVIILTASNDKKLKATITSRVQTIKINKIDLDDATNYFTTGGYSSVDIKRHYLFSNGSIGIVASLLKQDESIEYIDQITQAKNLLTTAPSSRLLGVDSLTKDKESLNHLIYSLKQVVRTALLSAIDKNDMKLTRRWVGALKSIQNSEDNLSRNANAKLTLTNLMLNL